MPKREKIHRLGGADPRSGQERFMGLVNRGVRSPAIKKQARSYDDSPATMRKNIKAADEDRARRGVTSRRPKSR